MWRAHVRRPVDIRRPAPVRVGDAHAAKRTAVERACGVRPQRVAARGAPPAVCHASLSARGSRCSCNDARPVAAGSTVSSERARPGGPSSPVAQARPCESGRCQTSCRCGRPAMPRRDDDGSRPRRARAEQARLMRCPGREGVVSAQPSLRRGCRPRAAAADAAARCSRVTIRAGGVEGRGADVAGCWGAAGGGADCGGRWLSRRSRGPRRRRACCRHGLRGRLALRRAVCAGGWLAARGSRGRLALRRAVGAGGLFWARGSCGWPLAARGLVRAACSAARGRCGRSALRRRGRAGGLLQRRVLAGGLLCARGSRGRLALRRAVARVACSAARGLRGRPALGRRVCGGLPWRRGSRGGLFAARG